MYRTHGGYRHPLPGFSPHTAQNAHTKVRVRVGEQRKLSRVVQVCEGGTKATGHGERGRAANPAGFKWSPITAGEREQRKPPFTGEGQEALFCTEPPRHEAVNLPWGGWGGGEDH